MKKLLCGILALTMALSMAACAGDDKKTSGSAPTSSGGEPTSQAPADDPILTGEKPELKILSMYQAYNYEEQPSYKLLEELTGYKTKWFMLPAENPDQKLLLEISGGADYDILLRISPDGYSQLSKQNALIELNGVLDKYGQKINELVSDFAWQSVTNADGVKNGIPHEDMVASKENPYGALTGGIGVRSDVLEEMNAKLPTTLDEFTQFLKDAKAKYGKTPLTANKGSTFTNTIMAAFDMGSAEWYDVNGTYTHRIKHPEMKNYLAYMQMLYKEKLIDNDMPINTGDNAKEKFASKNAVAIAPLMFWDIPAMVNALATNNPDAKAMFITDLAKDASTPPVTYVSKGAKFYTAISKNSKNPEHAINWLNILSDEKNYERVYIGEEGKSFEMKDGGYFPIFNEADKENDFSAYTNADKFSGIGDPKLGFEMWQARARKTPEMATAFEEMNSRIKDYDLRYTIESYGKTSPAAQGYAPALNQAFADSMIKAIVEGTDPDAAMAAMQADWDKNGGLELEKIMQEYYTANKKYAE